MKLLVDIINARGTDITGQIVITENNMTLLEHEIKRSGRPKYNWCLDAIEKYWNKIKTEYRPEFRFDAFNIHDSNQKDIIFQAAAEGWGTDKEGKRNTRESNAHVVIPRFIPP